MVLGWTINIPNLPFTFSAWVNPAGFTDWRAIISKCDGVLVGSPRGNDLADTRSVRGARSASFGERRHCLWDELQPVGSGAVSARGAPRRATRQARAIHAVL